MEVLGDTAQLFLYSIEESMVTELLLFSPTSATKRNRRVVQLITIMRKQDSSIVFNIYKVIRESDEFTQTGQTVLQWYQRHKTGDVSDFLKADLENFKRWRLLTISVKNLGVNKSVEA